MLNTNSYDADTARAYVLLVSSRGGLDASRFGLKYLHNVLPYNREIILVNGSHGP